MSKRQFYGWNMVVFFWNKPGGLTVDELKEKLVDYYHASGLCQPERLTVDLRWLDGMPRGMRYQYCFRQYTGRRCLPGRVRFAGSHHFPVFKSETVWW